MSGRKWTDKEARARLYTRLWVRDRVYLNGTWRVRCTFCGRFVSNNRQHTIIDHKDNVSHNNDPSNLQLIHRRCNYLKDPRGKRAIEKEQQAGDDDQISGEMRKSKAAEPLFIKWALEYVEAKGPQLKEILINAGAFVAKISTITAARYLKKLSSVEGPLMITWDSELDQEMVRFRQGHRANDEVQL